MKTLKMFVLIATIALSSAVSASTNPIEEADEPNLITKTVSKLLEDPYFQLNEDINATVQIAINKDNEIVVLSVDTNDEKVGDFIKNRLNYKKVPQNVVGSLNYYTLPVRMLKSQ
ncbi:hypothetical protein [Winogradskyella aquimaris]|uniref:Uncharacterized protein n=1 Tax=Winogradskyella aquimaris TaxID=864074 RepID=A0ABU5EPN2_9FLAO|nr:hypothetical protein [Winogradskyella aquimaris]MDY2588411.1 hypothetical protein [Winogradskyella aquimaris]